MTEINKTAKEIKEGLKNLLQKLKSCNGEISDSLDETTANIFMLSRVVRKKVVEKKRRCKHE